MSRKGQNEIQVETWQSPQSVLWSTKRKLPICNKVRSSIGVVSRLDYHSYMSLLDIAGYNVTFLQLLTKEMW